jgi:phosphoglycolate phosphatase
MCCRHVRGGRAGTFRISGRIPIMGEHRTTVVFDLDGTLIDTAPDLIDTLNHILTREGFDAVDYEAAREAIGAGAKRLLERGLARQGKQVEPQRLDALYQDYLAHYADHIADRSRPFPGMEAALDRLSDEGCILAVCTNKLEWLSVRLLDRLNLSRRFAAIVGQDTIRIAKPDPAVLRHTIKAAGGDIAGTIMVGDSITDIATARAASIPVIAVNFGYTDIPVSELNPDRIVAHYGALPETVRALSAARLRDEPPA